MQRIMLQVSPQELQTLKTMAQAFGISVSSYIREQLGFDALTRGRVPKAIKVETSPRPRGRPKKQVALQVVK